METHFNKIYVMKYNPTPAIKPSVVYFQFFFKFDFLCCLLMNGHYVTEVVVFVNRFKGHDI